MFSIFIPRISPPVIFAQNSERSRRRRPDELSFSFNRTINEFSFD